MRMMKKYVPVAAMLLLLVSCNKEESLRPSKDGDSQYVTVSINVAAGGLRPMTGSVTPVTKSATAGLPAQICDIECEAVLSSSPATKAIDDPTTTSNTTIKNLWVLQYDGTGDAAKLIGTPVYIEDYSVEANRSAKLVASTSTNTIVFLANTFDKTLPFQQNSSIAELKKRRFTTQSLGTILTIDPNTADVGGGAFPNNGDYYQRLNGFVEQAITEGSTLSCSLGHNACRISVNVTNNTAGTTYPVTLTSADIENVPGCMYYFTDYDGYTSGNNVGKPTATDLTLYELKNYSDIIVWAAGEGTSAATKSAKLYLSANESGVVPANESPKLKSMFAPSRATVLKIHGTFKDGGNDFPLTYTFALGEDMVKNYQLVPNGDYVYNITLNARGDKTSDGRVSYGVSGGVDYTSADWPLSNCYICNPPAVATASATYRIPVSRVDQFWGGGNYENVPNNCLKGTVPWTVSVIWSDMEVKAENLSITKASGTGKDDYFEVSVPGTAEMGNVVIGIKNNLSDDWLWSWHLWVTDYCPDEAKYLTQQGAFLDGTDTYHVTGGDVCRYQKAASGTVQKVYMDRPIGFISNDYVESGRGILYYQFGRKDPFPGGNPYWEGGTNNITYAVTTKAYNATDANQPQNVPFSVKNPATFITHNTSYWTYSDKYNPSQYNANIIWNDPSASNNGGKSIFDPSPSGWKVPASNNGLSFSSSSGYISYLSSSIIPKGGTISFLRAGCLSSSTGLRSSVSIGHYWITALTSETHGKTTWLTSDSMDLQINYGTYSCRANGEAVRPVQE